MENESSFSIGRENKVLLSVIIRVGLYVIILISPLLLAVVFRPKTDHSFIFEIGKNFSLLGLTILALQFLLGARIKWIEKPFGLDIVIGFHRFMGIFATVLILTHPILLSLDEKTWSLFFSIDVPWYIWIARIVWVVLLFFTVISVFRQAFRIDYQKWLRFHHIIAPVIVIAGFLHSWNAGGDLGITAIQVLWISLLSMSIIIYFYSRCLRPWLLRKHAYKVVEVLQESCNAWTIKLSPLGNKKCINYYPGQFHFITLQRSNGLPVEEHPFTISSSPLKPELISSTIKESGDFTYTISLTKRGDKAFIQGPFGRFSYVFYPEERDIVFIAGGVGITPFMSMLRHMRGVRFNINVMLFYANKTKEDIIFHDELAEIEASGCPGLRVVHILSKSDADWKGENGHLTKDKIHFYCSNDLEKKSFYLCGPPMMTAQIQRALKNLGVSKKRIHFEIFSL
jgi:predicted ferric reductase